MMNFYKTRFAGYNSNLPNSYIQTAQNYLTIAQNENQNGAVLRQYAQEAIDAANMAIKTTLPYMKNELKGTWIRPVETSREQIIATLDKIKADGFNSIFLETYFHGKTIFPSSVMNKYGFIILIILLITPIFDYILNFLINYTLNPLINLWSSIL